jgi:hypothetical protein
MPIVRLSISEIHSIDYFFTPSRTVRVCSAVRLELLTGFLVEGSLHHRRHLAVQDLLPRTWPTKNQHNQYQIQTLTNL